MDETEIGSMVVRLMGDSSDFTDNMQEATQAAEDAADEVQKHSERVEGFSKSIEGFAAAAARTLGALGIVSWLKEAKEAYGSQAKADKQLKMAMELNGREVDSLFDSYSKFASQMQDLVNVEDDATEGMLKHLELMGLTGDAAKRAIKNSIALAAVKGGEPGMYMRIAAALESGNSEMLGRMIPALRGIKDDSERTAKAQEVLGKWFEFAKAEAKSGAGQVKALGLAYGDLMEDFGKVVTEFTKPVKVFIVSQLQAIVKWFKDLSDEAKQWIVVSAGIAAGLLAFGPALASAKLFGSYIMGPLLMGVKALGVAIKLALTGHPIMLLVTLIASAIIAIGAFITKSGGIMKAWERIKDAASSAWEWITKQLNDFYEWARPIFLAIASFAKAAWDLIVEAATWAWTQIETLFEALSQLASHVWAEISDSAFPTWKNIRDAIVDAILFAQFTLENFGTIATHVWTGIKLGFVSFANQFMHFFSATVPYVAGYFLRNWKEMFMQAVYNSTQLLSNLVDNAVAIVQNIPGLISGAVNLSDITKPLKDGYIDIIKEQFVPPEREIGELERSIREQFEAQRGSLQQSWEEFRAGKLKDFGVRDIAEESKEDAADLGTDVGETFAEEVKKGMKSLESVSIFSAEAVARVRAYFDRDKGGKSASPQIAKNGGKEKTASENRTTQGPTKDNASDYLKRIAVATETTAKKDFAVFEYAEL